MTENKYFPNWLSAFVLLVTSICVSLLLFGCASRPPSHSSTAPKPYRVGGKWYQPLAEARDFTQRGIASWYGKKFHGRKTSNGEIYDMYGMTAAHKTLPLGTYVEVRNLSNGKTIKLRINDRGPFVRGRIIDLSYTAAKRLNILGPGTGRVEVVALGMARDGKGASSAALVPVDYYSGNFTFQVGAFTTRENAERLRDRLALRFNNAHIAVYDSGPETFYRVRVGKCSQLAEAEAFEQTLIDDGYTQAFIVAE